MRFRNFRNKFSKRNRIYSEDDILNMTLQNLFENENDVLAQNREIGIPTLTELQNSQNTLWIAPSIDDSGNEVKGHWTSLPNTLPPVNTNNVYNLKAEYNQPIQNIEQSSQEQMQNDILADLKAKYPDNKLISDSEMRATPLNPIQKAVQNVKNTLGKYEGLNWLEMAQKAGAKIPGLPFTEAQYYGQGLRFADGDEPTEFMKENNDFYKLSEIKDENLKKKYTDKLSQMYQKDMSLPENYEQIKDFDIVVSKENSQLHNQIKQSGHFQKWLLDNYDDIQNGKDITGSFEFPNKGNGDDKTLFRTFHLADIIQTNKNPDGSVNIVFNDGADYDKWNTKDWITDINNRAFEQQEKNQYKKYMITAPIHITKEEWEALEKLRRQY